MEKNAKITTLLNQPVQPLGLAGNPNMEEGCVTAAYNAGYQLFLFLQPVISHTHQRTEIRATRQSRVYSRGNRERIP